MKRKPKKRAPAAPAFAFEHAVPLPEAARLADVTDTWMRRLVETGKVAGVRIGRNYLIDRRSAAAYQRHPTAGRPRKP